jgi:hypothetical protein
MQVLTLREDRVVLALPENTATKLLDRWDEAAAQVGQRLLAGRCAFENVCSRE